jgi:hypothetical protein
MECKSMATPMIKILKKMSDSTSYLDLVDPIMYRKSIGSLMYLINTKPNIFFVVSALSQFMVESRHLHWVAIKHVLRYLCGTIGYGIRHVSGGEVRLQGYTNSYWEGSVVDIKSTLQCFFSIGSTMISQFRRNHNFVALSAIEAKYIATSLARTKEEWIQKILAGLFDQELDMTLIHSNNQSCVNIS